MHLLACKKDLHFEWQAKRAARERASKESRVFSRVRLARYFTRYPSGSSCLKGGKHFPLDKSPGPSCSKTGVVLICYGTREITKEGEKHDFLSNKHNCIKRDKQKNKL